jgi:hypothetical protein
MKCIAAGIAIGALILPVTNGRAETTTICGQSVNYALTSPTADLSPELRVFFGIWVGDTAIPAGGVAEATMCIGFVIESIRSNATVSAKYIWGDRVRYIANGNSISIKPGVNTWDGNITGEVLHFVSEDGKYSFDLHVAKTNELRGVFSTPTGRGDARMRRR